MKKSVIKNDVFYTIAWSPVHDYDRYNALRVLPELSGIISLMHKERNKLEYLIFYSCWRDGCRVGLKKFMDTRATRHPDILKQLDLSCLCYKFTVVESNIRDIQDIMFWLLKTYRPEYNNFKDFQDSRRYKNIYINEIERDKNDVVEKIYGHRS